MSPQALQLSGSGQISDLTVSLLVAALKSELSNDLLRLRVTKFVVVLGNKLAEVSDLQVLRVDQQCRARTAVAARHDLKTVEVTDIHVN